MWERRRHIHRAGGQRPAACNGGYGENEISYIFHQLNISPAIDYCAVDSETLSVIGATNADMVGKTVAKLGISAESMQNEEHGFHANIEGKYYYCVFKKIETRYMGFIIPMDVLYERIPLDLLNLALCLVFNLRYVDGFRRELRESVRYS